MDVYSEHFGLYFPHFSIFTLAELHEKDAGTNVTATYVCLSLHL